VCVTGGGVIEGSAETAIHARTQAGTRAHLVRRLAVPGEGRDLARHLARQSQTSVPWFASLTIECVLLL